MKIYRTGLMALAFATAAMFALPAGAEVSSAPAKQMTRIQLAAKGNCVPSGFAKLRRNCDANVGGCQRMPDSCSKGWCCP